MTKIRFTPIDSAVAKHYRALGADADGNPPQRADSDGTGNPCRHCLQDIAKDEPLLLLAHRPFASRQPFAETGPILIHAETCPAYAAEGVLPPMLRVRDRVILRGYDPRDCIVYDTAKSVETRQLRAVAKKILKRPDVAYIHLRSAVTTCFICRIDRA